MGSVPAHGLLYLTPNHGCGCYGFIAGWGIFPSPLSPAFDGNRLQPGSAQAASGGNGAFADNEWPMYLKDANGVVEFHHHCR